MLSQGLDCVIAASQFSFGERRVDFAVADLVKKNGGAAFPSSQFRDQVMVALWHAFRDRAQAQGADGVFHGSEFAR